MRRRGWRPVYAQTRWTRKLLFRKLRKHVAQSRFADCSAVNGDVDGFIAPRPRTGAVDVFDVLVDVFVCADRMGPVYCWPKIGLLTIANSKAWREVFNVRWPMIDKVGLLKLPSHILKEKYARRVPISYQLRQVERVLAAGPISASRVTSSCFSPVTSLQVFTTSILRFTDAMLVGQFRDQGIAFSAPRKKNRQGPLKPYGGFETAKLYLAKVCELSSFN